MEFNELMKTRYSVRKFKNEEVPDELIRQLLEAVYLAPTAENKQPLRVWTITDKERLEDIKQITKYHYNAPLTIAIGCVSDEAWVRPCDGLNSGIIDASIAATQLWLTAADVGLGAVWVSSFDTDKQKELFPEMSEAEIVVLMQVGYPDENAKPAKWHSDKRDWDEIFRYISE